MNFSKNILLIVTITLWGININVWGQASIKAGSYDEITMRDLQLLNKFNSNYSFSVRPIFLNVSDAKYIDSVQPFLEQLGNYNTIKHINNFTFIAQPIQFIQQYNTHSSWSRNNGTLLSVPGYQNLTTAGFSVISKYLDLQLMPEYNFSAKVPTKDGSYSNLSWGQSALRVHLGPLPFSVSLSTENLWWGPGIFNSLMMSNNAPGFKHLSIHTHRPWKLPFGIVEFQIIGGNLKSNSELPFENQNLNSFDRVFEKLPSQDTRYFNGLNISYSPIFMKGFSMGVNRMFQSYNADQKILNSFVQKYFPVFTSIFKSQAGGLQEDVRNRDQLINIFGRYVFPSVHAEIYGEYGWNDHSYNIRDLTLNPDHSAAYLVGFRKVFPLTKEKRFTFESELTQLEPTNSDVARGAGNWYVHSGVIEGYTNENQIMGGGITPGDNTATVRLTLSHKLNMKSITIERYEHDPRFHKIQWSDWSIGFKQQQFVANKLLISGGIDFVKRRGYEWSTLRPINFQFSLKAQYFW